MNKVGIYVRLSQEDIDKKLEGDESRSITNQKTMLVQYCHQQHLEVYDIYSDDDYTGSDRLRPGFQRLLRDAQAGKFEIVLCKSQSRFTREMELVEKYIHTLFPAWGIRFIGLVDHADTANHGNKKARQINGLINEWYLEDMSKSIRSVFEAKRTSGKHIGSFACFGYVKDPNHKGALLVDEEAASIVKEIYDMYGQGMGQVRICQILNERGVPNPATYKRMHGLNFKVGNQVRRNWAPTTIAAILKNEMYIGNMVQHKKENISYKSKKQRKIDQKDWVIVANTHEPIIEREQFIDVQARLLKHCRAYKNGTVNKFAHILVCGSCGARMATNSYRTERYFRCHQKVVHKNSCPGTFIKSSLLDEALIAEFKKFIATFVEVDFICEKLTFNHSIMTQIASLEKHMVSTQNQLEKISKAIQNLYLDKTSGVINESEYIEFASAFHDDKEHLENRLDEYNKQFIQRKLEADKQVSKQQYVETYVNNISITPDFIQAFIEKIVIKEKVSETEQLPISIYWKY